MSNPSTTNLRYFLFSQYFADGIRITLEVVLPAFICASFGLPQLGLTISAGAFCASICDAPGSLGTKRKALLYGIRFIFLMSLLTGFANHNAVTMGILIVAAAFFFTMLQVYGQVASAVGTAALLVMILRMDVVLPFDEVIGDSMLMLLGAIWYTLIAFLFFYSAPYRPVQRILGECIHETANFLKIKAALYDPSNNLESEYRKLVKQQVIVNEKQDAVRELLFQEKEFLEETDHKGRSLVLTFSEVMDLYEQIMATWYNYSLLRGKFGHTGILHQFSLVITELAGELDQIGLAIQSNSSYKKRFELAPHVEKIRHLIEEIPQQEGSKLVLMKILVNLRRLSDHLDSIIHFFSGGAAPRGKILSRKEYQQFVSRQPLDVKILKDNLHFDSSAFRHSLRMMITCGLGFVIAKTISTGYYSYWILLTIVVILKPAFSLTKQRNFERIIGTIGGGIIGVGILLWVQDTRILYVLIVFFMIGTYTFQRMNYVLMVIFVTPYVLILLSVLGLGFEEIAKERLMDTVIGSVLAVVISYIAWPQWEATQLEKHIAQVLRANRNYLQQLAALYTGRPDAPAEYKLVRKEVYVATANLAAAFHRMVSEPKDKQRQTQNIYGIVTLSHVLASNIASLAAEMRERGSKTLPVEVVPLIRRAVDNLDESIARLDKAYQPPGFQHLSITGISERTPDPQLWDQLEFIVKSTVDIKKLLPS